MGKPAAETRHTRVLLCDDTSDILALLSAEFGLHEDLEIVGKATDGVEVIDLARDLQPDVIVLDLVMPRLDGLQALPVLRTVAPDSTVIVLSAFEEEVMARRAVDMGATVYLEKGTPASAVADAVRANASEVA
jgi:DNA-binding NarL/FixJ family response regulator